MCVEQQPVAVSLIIVNYNGADLLPNCIETALATLPVGAELVVVDNASTDNSVALLKHYGALVRLVALDQNVGFGRACNLGVAAARGDVLIFLNPDVEFPANWLAPLLRALDEPNVGFVCPHMLYPNEPLPSPEGLLTEDRAMLPGCGLTARRSVWAAIGGFDERMFLYWEDTEVCWRAWLLGWRVVVARHSFVYHTRSVTTAAGRWDGERARNSLLTYLTLMRWRVIVPFALTLAAKTTLKWLGSRDPALLWAWIWNMLHVRSILARRRVLHARFRGDAKALEQLLLRQERQFRADREAHQVETTV